MDIEQPEANKEEQKQYFRIVKTRNFQVGGRFYLLDQASKDQTAQDIISNKKNLEQRVKEKHGRPADFLVAIGHSKIFTLLEYYLEHHDIQQIYDSKQEEICPICRFELFEQSSNITYKAIVENLEKDDENDVVKMDKCEGHYFHVGCLRNYINSQESKEYLKCPNCCLIYGVMTGDQPEGTMDYSLDKNSHCDGYKEGTISIQYRFPSGTLKDGKTYSGTSRAAYLPNTEEGVEVFKMLVLAFERRLIFTVGTSVTTGKKDTVVWNGIHHKTNLQGGTARFGYPDPTYFNRVKLELANKGIYPEDVKHKKIKL